MISTPKSLRYHLLPPTIHPIIFMFSKLKSLRPFAGIFALLLLLLICSHVLAASNGHGATPPEHPASSWDEGENTITPSTAGAEADSAAATTAPLIRPLPRASMAAQQDALALGWSLNIISRSGEENTREDTTEGDASAMPGAVFGDAFGPLLEQPALGAGRLKAAIDLPERFPPWLRENPLWLLVRITPSSGQSYFYAPFALGQSAQARLDTAKAVKNTELEIVDGHGEPIKEVIFYYPPGRLKQDRFSGLRLPVYQDEILVAASIPGDLLGHNVQLNIDALICTDSSCTPFRKAYPIHLGAADIESTPLSPSGAAMFMDYQTAPFGGSAVKPAETEQSKAKAQIALPNGRDALDSAIEQAALESGLAGYIREITPKYHVESLEVTNIWRAVLLGLLAGLILNFMPCVLPVISLKLGTLVGLGGWHGLAKNDESAKKSRRRFRLYSFCFTLGVFVWFGMLFGVIGFAGMMWGQFFQSQELILGLAMLLFVMALAMFGLVSIPLVNIQVSGKAALPYQAFFGGLLATLLATPCSGPLLGGVLGWAVNQSLPYLAATLFAVAAGMASPFILMTISPGLARFLPKPGPWAVTLERVMGFVLLGTVIYLLSMLSQTKIFVILSALLTLAFAAWLWSRPIAKGKSRFTLGRVLALVLLVPAIYLPFSYRVVDTSWKNFTPASFQADIGKRNILVDFTADWCINCRAMEVTTLTEQRLLRWGRAYDLAFVKVDLTGNNPDGEALLNAMGSASIPLLAIIPAHDPQNPIVLRDLVTPGQLDNALKQAIKGN